MIIPIVPVLANFVIYRFTAIPVIAVLMAINTADGDPLSEHIPELWYFALYGLLGYFARHILQGFIDERRENRATKSTGTNA